MISHFISGEYRLTPCKQKKKHRGSEGGERKDDASNGFDANKTEPIKVRIHLSGNAKATRNDERNSEGVAGDVWRL